MKKTTITYIDLDEVLHHLALTDEQEEAVLDMISHTTTWGDAYATLITSDSLIYMICEALDEYEMDRGGDGRTIHTFQEGLKEKYWQMIQKEDFINLESA